MFLCEVTDILNRHKIMYTLLERKHDTNKTLPC